MPQLLPFYFVNMASYSFLLFVVILYVLSTYILPKFSVLFATRMSLIANNTPLLAKLLTKFILIFFSLIVIDQSIEFFQTYVILFPFSTVFSLIPLMGLSNKDPIQELDPWFITGFTDAEGCFAIQIIKSKTYKTGWQIKPEFLICLHYKDLALLKKIQLFFKGAGNIYIASNKESIVYKIQDLKAIINLVIPHFDQFFLQSAKSVDYQLWKQCVILIINKEHLTQVGLEKIVSIKGAINLGLQGSLKNSFPNITSIIRPSFIISKNQLNPYWVTGFTDGDGSFTFTISQSKNFSIKACYHIHLHKREEALLIKIQEFFGMAGKVNSWGIKTSVEYRISRLPELNSKVLPHFEKFLLMGIKQNNFIIWKDIVQLLNEKAHLTEEGLAKLRNLKFLLNK